MQRVNRLQNRVLGQQGYLLFGIFNEIPHDHEVAFKAHLLDHVDFHNQALLIFPLCMAQFIFNASLFPLTSAS